MLRFPFVVIPVFFLLYKHDQFGFFFNRVGWVLHDTPKNLGTFRVSFGHSLPILQIPKDPSVAFDHLILMVVQEIGVFFDLADDLRGYILSF